MTRVVMAIEAPQPLNPDRVAAARAALPDDRAVEDVARALHVLGEPARLRIVLALLAVGELSVGDLAAATGLSETATSQHLRVLRSERSVRNRRAGRTVFYALADEHVRDLVQVALAHHAHRD